MPILKDPPDVDISEATLAHVVVSEREDNEVYSRYQYFRGERPLTRLQKIGKARTCAIRACDLRAFVVRHNLGIRQGSTRKKDYCDTIVAAFEEQKNNTKRRMIPDAQVSAAAHPQDQMRIAPSAQVRATSVKIPAQERQAFMAELRRLPGLEQKRPNYPNPNPWDPLRGTLELTRKRLRHRKESIAPPARALAITRRQVQRGALTQKRKRLNKGRSIDPPAQAPATTRTQLECDPSREARELERKRLNNGPRIAPPAQAPATTRNQLQHPLPTEEVRFQRRLATIEAKLQAQFRSELATLEVTLLTQLQSRDDDIARLQHQLATLEAKLETKQRNGGSDITRSRQRKKMRVEE